MSEPLWILCFLRIVARARPEYVAAARRLGAALARRGLGLVFGGGRVGIMGVVADAVLEAGGAVVGVIPQRLAAKEIAHEGVTELIIVDSMHERKALMASKAAAFLALPGGMGTFEEFFEILTWAALGIHNKPIGLLNVAGYFDPLLSLLDHAVAERFVRAEHLKLLLVSDNPEEMAAALPVFAPPPPGPLWIDLEQT